MKDVLEIFRRNLISPIVIAILTLSLILLILDQTRDALFVGGVIFLNTIIAIVQEIRAHHELKKLELMSAPKARVIKKSGKIVEVMFNQLVVGDNIQLIVGDEIPADGKLLTSSGLEADESILTGESAPVEKLVKSTVYAASIVVAGMATMQVTAVGIQTKVGSMTATLKRYTPQLTPIQKALQKAIWWLTYGALFLSVLIYVVYSLLGKNFVQIFLTITSSAATVVPEGLLLASSLLLAYGSIKLARAKVLPQKLAAIEAMALLDVLCVDKTGTLTSDEISFESLELFKKEIPDILDAIGIVALETNTGSKTGNAIASGLPAPKNYEVLQNLAFSSARKMSGLKFKYNDQIYSIVIGAPEFVEKHVKLDNSQKRKIDSLTKYGKRVLLVAMFDDTSKSIKKIDENTGTAIGIIVLTNELREGVEKTVSYLQKNHVSIRVISGDNPNTVSYIAKKAGIINHHKVLTGAQLSKICDENWDLVVSETTIFARVLPEQKERLIETFKRLGHFTGMVGDGVNDALAIKKSDLGVAMFAGAVATRRVADIVLLNNSFNSLPIGMKLGNRVMQAIELIATLFFHKLTYWAVLLLLTMLLGIIYPFSPRHITFMNIFLVTLPTVMWTIFTPIPRHRISPKYFWRDTLLAVLPIAILSGLVVAFSYYILKLNHPKDLMGVSTTTVIIATIFGIYLVFLVSRMFDIKKDLKSHLAYVFYVLATITVIIPTLGFSFIREFFDFTTPAWKNAVPLLIVLIIIALIQLRIADMAGNRIKKRDSI